MIIKKVSLHNIRSYEDAEIDIPEGSVLLSGDIGSGKSSVLFAIEFALFGLQPGQRGASLLKNGKEEGFVRLEIDIAGRDIIIERGLKRGKSVTQDYASLIVDNEKKEMSVGELKSFILNALNYPIEFAKKTNLLYKFTVYTPQEEMKQIIIQDAPTRLDTLRHIFGIDKYKRIEENLSIILTRLREEARSKEAGIRELELQKERIVSKNQSITKIEEGINETEARLAGIINERKISESSIKDVENKINEKRKYEQEIEKAGIMLANKKEQLARLEKTINETEKTFKEASSKFSQKELDEAISLISEKKSRLENMQKEHIDTIAKIRAFEIKKSEQQDKKNKISRMVLCPTCLQDVSERHKSSISIKIEQDTKEIEKSLAELYSKRSDSEKILNSAKDEILRLEKRKSELDILRARIESLRYDRVNDMKKEAEALKSDMQLLNSHLSSLKNSVFELSAFERIFESKKTELDSIKQKERAVEIKRAELKKEKEMITREINELKEDIKKKEEIKNKLVHINELIDWLSNSFMGMVQFTERNIMIKLREEFSSIFNKWFSVLVSETLRARLDEDFTPVIEQQGFEIDYAYLSGGERTAVALAYRLALNQIINSLLSRIMTKDIVILDEPTDGFSEQQLDKMRDVLQQLKVRQLILVSHEAKIESFVDKIIKFRKEDGVTKVEK